MGERERVCVCLSERCVCVQTFCTPRQKVFFPFLFGGTRICQKTSKCFADQVIIWKNDPHTNTHTLHTLYLFNTRTYSHLHPDKRVTVSACNWLRERWDDGDDGVDYDQPFCKQSIIMSNDQIVLLSPVTDPIVLAWLAGMRRNNNSSLNSLLKNADQDEREVNKANALNFLSTWKKRINLTHSQVDKITDCIVNISYPVYKVILSTR